MRGRRIHRREAHVDCLLVVGVHLGLVAFGDIGLRLFNEVHVGALRDRSSQVHVGYSSVRLFG